MDRMQKGPRPRWLRQALLVAAGLACWFQSASSPPSTFFTSSSKGPVDVAERPKTLDRKKLFSESRYLKFLLSSAEMDKVGVDFAKKLEQKTNTMILRSPKGDYYPWVKGESLQARSSKVMLIAGEEEDVLEAFKTIRETVARSAKTKYPIHFIVPTRAMGHGLGLEEIKQKSEALNFPISIQGTPTHESHIVPFSDSPETADDIAKWLLETQGEYRDHMQFTLATRYQRQSADEFAEILVMLTERQSRQFVGKGGRMIKNFSDWFHVKFDIDRDGGPDGSVLVKMRGLLGDVHAAHRELMERFMVEK